MYGFGRVTKARGGDGLERGGRCGMCARPTVRRAGWRGRGAGVGGVQRWSVGEFEGKPPRALTSDVVLATSNLFP